MKRLTIIFFTILFTSTVLPSLAYASETSGTINTGNSATKICKDTTCSVFGNINWKPTINGNTPGATPVTITDSGLTGYLWGDEIGWVNLSPTGSGVTINASTGALSGYAYANTGGWINFHPTPVAGNPMVGVSINSVGEFIGYAYVSGLNGGWMKFDCTSGSTCVKTDWRPTSVRTVVPSGGGGGGVVGLQYINQPVQPTTSATSNATTTTTTTTTTYTSTNKTPTYPYQYPSNTQIPGKTTYPSTSIDNTTPGYPYYPNVGGSTTTTITTTSVYPSIGGDRGSEKYPTTTGVQVERKKEKLLAYPFIPERLQWRIPLSRIAPAFQAKTHVMIPDVDGTTIVLTLLAGLFLWKFISLVVLGIRSLF